MLASLSSLAQSLCAVRPSRYRLSSHDRIETRERALRLSRAPGTVVVGLLANYLMWLLAERRMTKPPRDRYAADSDPGRT